MDSPGQGFRRATAASWALVGFRAQRALQVSWTTNADQRKPTTQFKERWLTTFNGLPAHVLLVHFIVILAPLTAILAILCALWPAARRRLTWLVLGLAASTAVLTPLTTSAGEWLERREGQSPLLHAHTELATRCSTSPSPWWSLRVSSRSSTSEKAKAMR